MPRGGAEGLVAIVGLGGKQGALSHMGIPLERVRWKPQTLAFPWYNITRAARSESAVGGPGYGASTGVQGARAHREDHARPRALGVARAPARGVGDGHLRGARRTARRLSGARRCAVRSVGRGTSG